ncbi:dnaJ homolog subfamily C member 11-like [Centruroides sculpturatus]|uniref:dnaJ homolog subfamily C member 11-like n=1 Tax=Centruroides sculpturatus TaxID=218467 RepID=UPI000C6D4980|nr:dnaJ homolog subfamily C member 11-like [Centruroides sculpturatus]
MAHPMSEDEDEGYEGLDDDYYAFFNVSKTATSEEVSNAYRRLSKLYHPDKHNDAIKKKDAEVLFNKTRRIYEGKYICIDEKINSVTQCVVEIAIVQRTKTPQEIREEYEQLAREREERRLQQRTNPKGTVSVGIDATGLFENYEYEDGWMYSVAHQEKQQSLWQILSSVVVLFGSPVKVEANPIFMAFAGTVSVGIDATGLFENYEYEDGWMYSVAHQEKQQSLWQILSSVVVLFGSPVKVEANPIFMAFAFEVGAGQGFLSSLKVFHRISNRCFSNMQGILQFTPNGIRPGLSTMIARQLDKHTVGYLTWKTGHRSSMTTTVVWDSNVGHFVGALQFGIPDTFIMASYSRKLHEDGQIQGSLKLGTFGVQVEYGCETKVSKHSVLGASLVVGIPAGVTLKIRLNRASQMYVFPLQLSEEILPSAIFYGTVVPLVAWYVVKVVVIKPYVNREKKRKAQKAQEANAAKLAEKRQEAKAAISLMQETYNRIREQEETKSGLVITKALYGKLIGIENRSSEDLDEQVVDVLIPLQCLVKDSRLVLTDSSKSNLPGFYDPCFGEDKYLVIFYKFRNLPHTVTINDLESLRLPKESHLQQS